MPILGSGINKDRIPSRHEKQRNENADANQAQYYLFGDQKGKDMRQSRGSNDRQKTNIVEVLEFE